MLLAKCGQDADYDQAAADAARLLVGGVEASADLLLQLSERVPGQLPGWNVDFQVELPELRPPGRIGERFQHPRVAHGRRHLPADQVQFDLQADLRRVGLERPLAQHSGERV